MRLHRFLPCAAFIVVALQLSGCSGSGQPGTGTSAPVEAVATLVALDTYPDDFINGPGRGCAGLEIAALGISIPPDGQPTYVPANPARPPARLVWPEGFTLRHGQDGPEIAGPNGMTIRDGDILRDVEICTGIDAYYLRTFTSITRP